MKYKVMIFFYIEQTNNNAVRPVAHWSDQQPSALAESIISPGFKTLFLL